MSVKIKLNTMKVLIFKVLIESYINHDEFVSVNNVLREYNEMKEEVKIPENFVTLLSVFVFQFLNLLR